MISTRIKIEEKVNKKKKEIQALEEQLVSLRSELKGMDEILKMLPKEGEQASPKQLLRPKSLASRAYKILKRQEIPAPMYVDDILSIMKKGINKKNRSSLASILSQYSRRHEVFNRPEPNTFGLLEWGNIDSSTKSDENVQLTMVK